MASGMGTVDIRVVVIWLDRHLPLLLPLLLALVLKVKVKVKHRVEKPLFPHAATFPPMKELEVAIAIA